MQDNITFEGSTYNILSCSTADKDTKPSIGKVIKLNEYGFVSFSVNEEYKDKKYFKQETFKRHVSDFVDLEWIVNKYSIDGLYFNDGMVKYTRGLIVSEPVYVLHCVNSFGINSYISRVRKDSILTIDVTKAWFTFNYKQALLLANKLNKKYEYGISVKSIYDIPVVSYSEN